MPLPLSAHGHVRRHRFSAFTFSAFMVTSTALAQQPAPTIAPWEHLGQVVTVCGTVVSIDCQRKGRGVWLDLDEPFPDGGVSLSISDADRPALGARIGRFLLQPVCGTGRIENHDGRFLVQTTPGDLIQKGLPSTLPSGFQGSVYTACDDGVSRPKLVREVQPRYTMEAMKAKKRGKVLVDAVVRPDGRVGDVVVAVSLDKTDGLDSEAVAAVKQWLFKPGTLGGRPVPVIVSVELDFNLK